jgi:hypothetical protein
MMTDRRGTIDAAQAAAAITVILLTVLADLPAYIDIGIGVAVGLGALLYAALAAAWRETERARRVP